MKNGIIFAFLVSKIFYPTSGPVKLLPNFMSALTTPRMKPPFTMIGSSVAEVEESKHPNFPVGATIVIMAGLVNQPSPLLSLFQHLENREI